ncbi:MAG: 4Fe-4S dicluster domain-containing protein [Candidatus Lokiarchaeota archaeon]|nr:4Fe-4S dicluster domain-containing protein [Candidatus Lokiarchaeota archaeon]MBD3338500.1 4Fe-4S dicluster domain-containing protein [Candidatus Lokiarchaeota archaeon]
MEKFIPIQIDQELCMHCERCLRACRQKAIYFEKSMRLVDYSKCRGCLSCIQVCPKNAIQVTSVEPNQVVSVKIDHEKCSMCGECLKDNGRFCPNHLFFEGDIKDLNGKEKVGIKFKFKEIEKCQGCLKCESSCPEGAIKPIQYDS